MSKLDMNQDPAPNKPLYRAVSESETLYEGHSSVWAISSAHKAAREGYKGEITLTRNGRPYLQYVDGKLVQSRGKKV